ncbi:MAG: hypothetical protein GY941_11365 [Planctomycetes bacterium]|nr:hypothetical protein [Planctomycetota bacterium]
MNCNNVRKYFYAFTDNELNVDKNLEILEHLNICYGCSQKMERERLIHKRVRETVSQVKAPDYLERLIIERADKPVGIFALFRKSWFIRNRIVMLSGIAAAVILVVCFLIIPANLRRCDMIHFAESEYHNFLTQSTDLDIRSRDADTVEKYLQKHSNSRVSLPEMQGVVSLIGATLSDVGGISVSQVFYMNVDIPVSVMIICDTDSHSEQKESIDFSAMKKIIRDGMGVYYKQEGYCSHCKIIGWSEAGNQYVMVSMLHSNEMMSMLVDA